MRLLRTLALPLLVRRTLHTLASIDARLAEQNTYLARLADHFAPAFGGEAAPARIDVDYLNVHEAATVLAYVEKMEREQGRAPTEVEILRYLADEATVDLQSRMEQGI